MACCYLDQVAVLVVEEGGGQAQVTHTASTTNPDKLTTL